MIILTPKISKYTKEDNNDSFLLTEDEFFLLLEDSGKIVLDFSFSIDVSTEECSPRILSNKQIKVAILD